MTRSKYSRALIEGGGSVNLCKLWPQELLIQQRHQDQDKRTNSFRPTYEIRHRLQHLTHRLERPTHEALLSVCQSNVPGAKFDFLGHHLDARKAQVDAFQILPPSISRSSCLLN
jgi:hypothetical protein